MGLLLKQLFALIKMLNSETGHNQIAAGIALGFILGMTPVFSLQAILVFLLIFVFRIQMGAAFLAAFFFKFAAYLLDPAFDAIGTQVLQADALQGLWTALYNMPIVPLTRFNNSIVMGSGVVTIVLSPFVFIGSKIAIIKYRATVVARFKQTRFWKAIQATSFYKWYYSYDKLYR